jgi:hypothetical protein
LLERRGPEPGFASGTWWSRAKSNEASPQKSGFGRIVVANFSMMIARLCTREFKPMLSQFRTNRHVDETSQITELQAFYFAFVCQD